jgi:hypothetical protein
MYGQAERGKTFSIHHQQSHIDLEQKSMTFGLQKMIAESLILSI